MDIIEKEMRNEEPVYMKQSELRMKAIKKIEEQHPDWKKTIQKKRADFAKFVEQHRPFSRSFYITNADHAAASLDFFINLYEEAVLLNEENQILNARTNDEIFANKNREISELKDMLAAAERKQRVMFSLEEIQDIFDWYEKHIKETPQTEHHLDFEIDGCALGINRNIKCSCGMEYDLGDWKSW